MIYVYERKLQYFLELESVKKEISSVSVANEKPVPSVKTPARGENQFTDSDLYVLHITNVQLIFIINYHFF